MIEIFVIFSFNGVHGVVAMIETDVAFGKEIFKAWETLQGLDMDENASNFGAVEILRKVEGLEEFKRGCVFGQEYYLEES